jgi:hypothetical protein
MENDKFWVKVLGAEFEAFDDSNVMAVAEEEDVFGLQDQTVDELAAILEHGQPASTCHEISE